MKQFILLMLAIAVVFGFGLGDASLWDIDEAIYADIARNMAETGDWVFPVFNSEPRFDKPPLLFWIGAAAVNVLGPGELSARIGTYLFALLSVALVYAFGRRYYSHRAGMLGAAILASTLGWFIAGRVGLMDTGLSFFIGLSLYQLARAAEDDGSTRKPGPYVWLGVAVALGVLTKGPVALVLVGGTALLYLGPVRLWRVLAVGQSLLGAATFLVIALPWHLAIYSRAGRAWWESYFGYHMFARFTQPLEEHGFGWYFYIIVLVVGFLPWTGYALAGAWSFLRRRRLALDPGARLMLSWFAVVVLFFSVSRTKLPGYVLPAFLPLAVLTGAWCHRRLDRVRGERAFLIGLWTSAGAGMLAVIGLIALRPIVPDGYEQVHRLLFVFPLTLVGGMLVTKALHLARRDAKTLAYGFAATAFVGMLLFSGLLAPVIEDFKPVRPLMEAAKPLLTTETRLISAFGDASSNYYAGRPVTYVHGTEAVRRLLKEPGPAVLLVPAAMVDELPGVEVIDTFGPGALLRAEGRDDAPIEGTALPGNTAPPEGTASPGDTTDSEAQPEGSTDAKVNPDATDAKVNPESATDAEAHPGAAAGPGEPAL